MVKLNKNDINILKSRLKRMKYIFLLCLFILVFFWFASPFWRPRTGGKAPIQDLDYLSALLYSLPFFIIPIFLTSYFLIREMQKFKDEIDNGLKERIRGKVERKKSSNQGTFLFLRTDEGEDFKLKAYQRNDIKFIEVDDLVWVTFLPKLRYIIRIKKVG